MGAVIALCPLTEARRLGNRIGTLCASKSGVGVYRKLGFLSCCTLGFYLWKSA